MSDGTVRGKLDPAALRDVFGQNLRALSVGQNITRMCEEMGLPRSRYNRLISMDGRPRPEDVAIVCQYFGLDARILTTPLEEYQKIRAEEAVYRDTGMHPFVSDHLASLRVGVSEERLPSGLYRLGWEAFLDDGLFILGLCRVFRIGNRTFVRGKEHPEIFRSQGFPEDLITHETREFRGEVVAQNDGFMVQIGRKNTDRVVTAYASKMGTYGDNYYSGFTTINVAEGLQARARRVLFERLSGPPKDVLAAARECGIKREDTLPRFYRAALRPDKPFR